MKLTSHWVSSLVLLRDLMAGLWSRWAAAGLAYCSEPCAGSISDPFDAAVCFWKRCESRLEVRRHRHLHIIFLWGRALALSPAGVHTFSFGQCPLTNHYCLCKCPTPNSTLPGFFQKLLARFLLSHFPGDYQSISISQAAYITVAALSVWWFTVRSS